MKAALVLNPLYLTRFPYMNGKDIRHQHGGSHITRIVTVVRILAQLTRNTKTYVNIPRKFVFSPVSPMGSCRARSVYLTTRLLGRLSPLSG